MCGSFKDAIKKKKEKKEREGAVGVLWQETFRLLFHGGAEGMGCPPNLRLLGCEDVPSGASSDKKNTITYHSGRARLSKRMAYLPSANGSPSPSALEAALLALLAQTDWGDKQQKHTLLIMSAASELTAPRRRLRPLGEDIRASTRYLTELANS